MFLLDKLTNKEITWEETDIYWLLNTFWADVCDMNGLWTDHTSPDKREIHSEGKEQSCLPEFVWIDT